MTRIDIAVIGGGPAGALCAWSLARSGARVALIERASPLETRTTRAELVSGQARRVVAHALGADVMSLTPALDITETRALWHGAMHISSSMINPCGPGAAIDRGSFDAALRDRARAAGAMVLEGRTVVRAALEPNDSFGLDVLPKRRTGAERLQTDFIVCATGRSSTAWFGQPREALTRQLALVGRVNCPFDRFGARLYVEDLRSPRLGDAWVYALPDPNGGVSIGMCTPVVAPRGASDHVRDLLHEGLAETRLIRHALGDDLPTAVRGCSASVNLLGDMFGRHWIAIGDAAFAADPLSGLGLEFAVYSALAAASIIGASWPPRALTAYADAVHAFASRHQQTALDLHTRESAA